MTEYRAMRVKFPHVGKRRKTWRTAGYGVFPVPLTGTPRMVASYAGPFASVRARLSAARLNRRRG